LSGSLVVGEFDASGLTVDTRTGKVGGNWTELTKDAAKRLDHQTVAELCRCCGVELLRSGSKWSVWFCKECKRRVEELNRNAGACVVPIGRHTLMHGIGVTGDDAVRDPTLLKAFAAAASDFLGKQNHVSEWAHEIVRRNCATCALAGDNPVPISTYLEAVASQSRQAAFDAMCEWWRGFTQSDDNRTHVEVHGQRSLGHSLASAPSGSRKQLGKFGDGSSRVESKLRAAVLRLISAAGWACMAAILAGIASQASTDTSNRIEIVCVGLVVCKMSKVAFAETQTPWKAVANVSLAVFGISVLFGLAKPQPPDALQQAVLQWCQTLSEATLNRASIRVRVLHETGELPDQCVVIQNQGSRGFNGNAMFYALLILGTPTLVGALLSQERFSKFDAMMRERGRLKF